MLRLPQKVTHELHQMLHLETLYTMREAPQIILQRHHTAKKKSHDQILLKHETLFTMREAAQVILQRHQMLRLSRKNAQSS